MISSNPTAEELVQYSAWLAEAESALHRINIGAQEVSVSHDGESVTFRAASAPQLKAYINQLRKALGKPLLANPGFASKPVTFNRLRAGSGLL